ncbi:substrate-binding domain-containing protein [Carnobacterium sp. TMP28]|uniref:substrate-binding domain-containing protein n=1 Tax=Carnobacterium sp. TMP28 TaxID=3397060 RepID=UPI0039E18A2D
MTDKKRRNQLLVGLFCLITLLVGCVKQSTTNQTIMLILDSQDSYHSQMIEEGVATAISEYDDVSILKRVPDKKNDSDQQTIYLKEAIDLKVETIIFSAVDIEKNKKELDLIYKKGIKLIMIDSFLSDPYEHKYIGTNNKEAGELAGKAVIQKLGKKAKIGILNFEDRSTSGQEREKEQAFYDFIDQFSTIEIIEKKLSWSDSETVQLLTEEMLDKYPEMDGIVAFNERTTIGAGRAIKIKKLQDEVAVIGFDSQKECIELLEDESIDALIVQNPFAIGYLSIQQALNPAENKKIAEPMFTEVEWITKKNMYQSNKEKFLFPFSPYSP